MRHVRKIGGQDQVKKSEDSGNEEVNAGQT